MKSGSCEGGERPLGIAAEGVTFGYRRAAVLTEVSLTVQPGEWAGVLGPNGAGKSTLLKLLAGLLTPRAGAIRYGRTPCAALSRRAIARLVAYVPQETAVVFPLRAREVVMLGRLPHLSGLGWAGPRDRAIVAEAMAAMACATLAERPVHTLSGGERQRVFIARALAQAPRILLCDEPTTHLDLSHQIACLRLLRQWCAARRLTIVTALHDLNLAARYCDTVGLLHQGRLHAFGPPAAILTRETIATTFATDVYVGIHPQTGHAYYAPAD